MITSIFNKTRPLNYLLLGVALLVTSFLYFFFNQLFTEGPNSIGYFVLYLFVLGFSVALVDFIAVKNSLTKGNNYAVALFFIFILFFPKTFENGEILISNLFLLLALRRLISIKSLIATKEKIFDASFWIFLATLFHFWSILYIALVFIAIILHAAGDYRNWIIPFIAFFTIGVLFSMVNLMMDNQLLPHLLNQSFFSFDFTYFESIYQNIALALFSSVALLFFINMIFTLQGKPLNMKSSFKKLIFSFLLGIAIYVFSANKNNSCLIFSLAPLSIMGANFFEGIENKILKEVVFDVLLLLGIVFFVASL